MSRSPGRHLLGECCHLSVGGEGEHLPNRHEMDDITDTVRYVASTTHERTRAHTVIHRWSDALLQGSVLTSGPQGRADRTFKIGLPNPFSETQITHKLTHIGYI